MTGAPAMVGTVLLALGDSIAAGIGASHVSSGCMAVLASALRPRDPGLALVNLAIPGESSHSMLLPGGQLDRAEEVIAEVARGGGRVGPVALCVGGNDIMEAKLLGDEEALRLFGRNLGAILAVAGDDPRLGVCLDTCHSFANGYDLRTPAGVRSTIDEFESAVGFDRLVLVHANDSREELGANRDRHANIGEGLIGTAGFGMLLADPRLRRVPWVLEVPGEGQGPDLANVNRLRELAGLAPAVARDPYGAVQTSR